MATSTSEINQKSNVCEPSSGGEVKLVEYQSLSYTCCATKWTKTSHKTHFWSPGFCTASPLSTQNKLLPKHVAYPTVTATRLSARGFSTACNGKMCAVGIGYGIGMDGSSCRDCWTLQDSITDLAPRPRSPFTGESENFCQSLQQQLGHQCQTLEEVARTHQ